MYLVNTGFEGLQRHNGNCGYRNKVTGQPFQVVNPEGEKDQLK